MPVEIPKASLIRYIVVGGSDKIGITAFNRLALRILGPQWEESSTHWLMSPEELNEISLKFKEATDRGVLVYYVKFKKTNREPNSLLPAKMMELGDLVVWFELYQDQPTIVKTPQEADPLVTVLMAEWSKIISGVS